MRPRNARRLTHPSRIAPALTGRETQARTQSDWTPRIGRTPPRPGRVLLALQSLRRRPDQTSQSVDAATGKSPNPALPTKERWLRVGQDAAYEKIRNVTLFETEGQRGIHIYRCPPWFQAGFCAITYKIGGCSTKIQFPATPKRIPATGICFPARSKRPPATGFVRSTTGIA